MGFIENRSEESTCRESDYIDIKFFEQTPYGNNTLTLSISLNQFALINVFHLEVFNDSGRGPNCQYGHESA